MLYRKSSPRPPTLLLRIVATAGAGALLGATAFGCSMGEALGFATAPPPADTESGSPGPCNGGPCGSAVMPPDSGEAGVVGGGVVANPDSGADSQGPCHGGPCGSVAMPVDAGEASVMGMMVGLVPNPDSGADAHGPCNGGLCGVVIHPEAGFDQ